MSREYKKYFGTSLFIGLLVILQTIFSPILISSFASDDPFQITKTTSVSTVQPGRQFHYEINYAVIDNVNDYTNVYIVDNLPENVEFISVARNDHISEDNIAYDSGNNKLTIKLVSKDTNILEAGATGVFQINVRLKEGTVKSGDEFVNKATIEADVVTPIESNPTTVTATGTDYYWQTSKIKISPTPSPVTSSKVTYRLRLDEDNTEPYGHLNIKNVYMIDTLPSGAIFVSASDSGMYNSSNHTVKWYLGDVNTNSTIDRQVTVLYPGDTFNTGDSVTNHVHAEGKDLNGNDYIVTTSSAVVTFVDPDPPTIGGTGFSKTRDFLYREIGQTQRYDISGINNKGNVEVDNLVVIDDNLPSQIDYETIYLPSPNGEESYSLGYKTNINSNWRTININPSEVASSKILISDIVSGGEYLTDLKFDFGTVPAGFDAGTITIEGTVVDPDNEGQPVNHEDQIDNDATLSFKYNNVTSATTSKTTFYIKQPKPWLYVSKTHDSSKYYIHGDDVEFNITVRNLSSATGVYKNPIVYDVLPDKFEYVTGSAIVYGSAIDKDPGNLPKFETSTVNIDGKDRTLLKWSWPNESSTQKNIDIGDSFNIKYTAKISEYTPSTITGSLEYINETYITTIDDPNVGFWWGSGDGNDDWDNDKLSIIDINNLDNDGGQEEYLINSDREVYINETATAQIYKWNKGILDADYNRYPDKGKTIQGGTVDYKLEIKNTGNVKLEKIEILDILPYVGDTGVLNDVPRESEWKPNLLKALDEGAISSSGITANLNVKYSISSDKSYVNFDEISNTTYWMDEIPENYDLSSIQSLYFEITNINSGDGLDPGESIDLEWKMRAPVGAPENKVAYNSVGAKLSTVTDKSLLASEPIKVGFEVVDDNTNNSNEHEGQIGDFVWVDGNRNGIQDDGYDDQKGGLNGIVVKLRNFSDNSLVDETITGDNQDGKPGYYLFPHVGEGEYYVEFVLPDYYEATNANTTDDAFDSDGINPSGNSVLTDKITMVYDSSDGYVTRIFDIDLGLVSKVHTYGSAAVTKTAVSVLSKSVNPATEPLNTGETIVYNIEINNNGTVPLTNVLIEDIMETPPQTGFTFTKIGPDISNLAGFSSRLDVTEIDNTSTSTSPAILIDKIEVGESIILQGQYNVKNSDVNLTSLDNTVSIKANEFKDGESITSTENVDIADISISKSSSESAVEPGASGFDTIHYTITVTNNSNIALNNIKVLDNRITTFTNEQTNPKLSLIAGGIEISTLDPNESIDIIAEYISQQSDLGGNIVNTATISHPDIRTTEKSSTSVKTKGMKVEKSEASSGLYRENDTISYEIRTTNTGTEDLTNVVVTDRLYNLNGGSNYTPIETYTITNLAAGEVHKHTVNHVLSSDEIDLIYYDSLKNNAYATTDDLDRDVVSNDVIVNANVSLAITKTAISVSGQSIDPAVDPANVDETIIYNIEIENDGTETLTDIVVRDNMDIPFVDGFAFTKIGTNESNLINIEDSPRVDDSNNSGLLPSITIDQLNIGEKLLLQGQYTVKDTDANKTSLDNTITTWASEFINNDTVSFSETVDIADISISKTSSESAVEPGAGGYNIIHYNINVVNNSNITLNNVLVEDDMITTFTGIDADSNLSATDGGVVIAVFNPADSMNITGEYKATTNDLSDGIDTPTAITNTAVVKHPDIRTNPHDSVDVETKGIKVEKREITSGPYEIDDQIIYEIKTFNIGTIDLINVLVTDRLYNLEQGTTYSAIDTYIIDNLTSGAVHTKQVSHQLNEDDIEILNYNHLKNVAYVKILNMEQDAKSNEVIVDTKLINITKSGIKAEVDKFFEIGDIVEYTFEIKNEGSFTLHNVLLNDPELDLVDEVVGDITPGAIVTLNYNYEIKEEDLEGSIVNIATVTCDEGIEDSDTDIIGDPAIEIIKNVIVGKDQTDYIINNYEEVLTSDLVNKSKGTDITYIFTITNTGDTYLNNISVIDNELGITEGALTLIPELSNSSTFDEDTIISANDEKLVFYYETQIEKAYINTAYVTGVPCLSTGSSIDALEEVVDDDTAQIRIPYFNIRAIGDYIWIDEDKDGLQDPGEKGVSGIKVSLKNNKGNLVDTETTDSNGKYLFENLNPGKYTVEFSYDNLKELGYEITYDYDGNKDNVTVVDLLPAYDELAIDFGLFKPQPSLSIDKTGDKMEAEIGEEIKYTIKVKNTGNIDLTNVHIVDEMLNIDKTISVLETDDQVELTGSYTISENDFDKDKLTNIVNVSTKETGNQDDFWDVIIIKPGTDDEEPEEEPEENPEEEPEEDPDVVIYEPEENDETIEIIEEPEHGTVTIDDEGNITYTPDDRDFEKDKVVIKIIKDDEEEIITIEIFEDDIPFGDIEGLPDSGEMNMDWYYALSFSILGIGLILQIYIKRK